MFHSSLSFFDRLRFPWKLHIMLDAMDRTGDESVVCWQPHGRAFMVHKPREFVHHVMPHFFNQTKYASFQRQLNLYGFSRLTHGPDKGAYYHGCFVRGERSLCREMVRQKIKGTKVRRSLAPDEEPNFYSPNYNNNKVIPSPILPSPDITPSTSATQRAQVTPDQSPRTLTIKSLDMPSSESLVSMLPTFQDSMPSNPQFPKPARKSKTAYPSPKKPSSIPRTVSPHQTVSTMHRLQAVPDFQSSIAVKGGDLLFFEGQPFRYLEHLEELPPPRPFKPKVCRQCRHQGSNGIV